MALPSEEKELYEEVLKKEVLNLVKSNRDVKYISESNFKQLENTKKEFIHL